MEIIRLCHCCGQKAKKDGVISGERHTLSMVGRYQLRHFVDVTEKNMVLENVTSHGCFWIFELE